MDRKGEKEQMQLSVIPVNLMDVPTTRQTLPSGIHKYLY